MVTAKGASASGLDNEHVKVLAEYYSASRYTFLNLRNRLSTIIKQNAIKLMKTKLDSSVPYLEYVRNVVSLLNTKIFELNFFEFEQRIMPKNEYTAFRGLLQLSPLVHKHLRAAYKFKDVKKYTTLPPDIDNDKLHQLMN